MSLQLRQICLVAEKLAPVVDDLSAILGIKACYVDPEVAHFGLENTLFPIGRNFLEVVAPVRPNTAGGRYLARRGGDGGYMVITQTDSLGHLQTVRDQAAANGVRVAYESERDGWHLCQFHPGDLKAAFLEVEYDKFEDFQGNWMPAGGSGWEDKVDQSVTVDYLACELQSDDPVALAELWSAVCNLPVTREGPVLSIALGDFELRFVSAADERGPGLSGLELAVRNRDHVLRAARERHCYVNDHRVDICGMRIALRDV